MTENDLLRQTALAYAQRYGWPVFPLAPGAKIPPQGTHSFKDASTDPDDIRHWWARWPGANIGLACGADGLVVVDLDVKGEADGIETWRQLVEGHNIAYTTLASHIPSGGWHLIYRCPPGIQIGSSAGTLGPGVDVRSQGGYIVLPPSILRGGDPPRRYAWQRGPDARKEPAPLPAPLLALLAPGAPPSPSRPQSPTSPVTQSAKSPSPSLRLGRAG